MVTRAPIASQIQLKPHQIEAAKLAQKNEHKYILYRGGSGSGKSYLISYILFMRGLRAPGSRHGIFRETAASCRQTLFDLTFRNAIEATYPGYLKRCKVSEAEATIELPNGSTFFFLGLDDSRRDKILGNEFSTIWVNECNGADYKHVEFLMSRLRERKLTGEQDEAGNPIILQNKMFFDCNPNSKKDWDYKCFILKKNPKDNTELKRANRWVEFKMDPENNVDNLGEDFLEELDNLTGVERRRLLDGEWSEQNEHAIFFQANIDQYRVVPSEVPELVEVVVGYDPAVSSHKKSDKHGVVVVGIDENDECYVLADYSGVYNPSQAAQKVADAYHDHGATYVIAESNQGGELVEQNLRTADKNLPVISVHAREGKRVRAEPVSNLYERGLVHHVGKFEELEDEMCSFGGTLRHSPDHMDALVYAIFKLRNIKQGKRTGKFSMVAAKGFGY